MNAITEFMSKHFAPANQQPGIIAAREELAAEQAAEVARKRAALWMYRDHAEALFDNATHDEAIKLAHTEAIALNAQFDAARDLARCNETAAALLADASAAMYKSPAFRDDAMFSVSEMTDDDIIHFGNGYCLDLPALVARLEEFCVRARGVMGVAV